MSTTIMKTKFVLGPNPGSQAILQSQTAAKSQLQKYSKASQLFSEQVVAPDSSSLGVVPS